jgi:D-alanine-D-alanine ligase
VDIDELSKEKLPVNVRIRMFIRNKTDEMESNLKKMVNINTHVRNVDGVNDLGQFIWKELSPLGFMHNAYPQVEIGNMLLLSNTDENDYDVLLLTHLDSNVPFKKHMRYRETENKLYGTAIWDSKGGITVMIAALKALRFVRKLRKFKIGILLTTDDTLQGLISKTIIKELSGRARVVLGLYGASLGGSIVTSRSGAAIYDCQMSIINAEKELEVAMANAKFTRLITNLAKLSNDEDRVIVNPREIKLNSNIPSLFSQGEVSISVRYNLPEQFEVYNKKINDLVRKIKSDKVSVNITGAGRRDPMVKNDKIIELYQRAKDIANKIDVRFLEEHRWSSSNICHVDDNIAKLDGLGPIGISTEDKEEHILRHSLLDRAVLLALLIYKLRK